MPPVGSPAYFRALAACAVERYYRQPTARRNAWCIRSIVEGFLIGQATLSDVRAMLADYSHYTGRPIPPAELN